MLTVKPLIDREAIGDRERTRDGPPIPRVDEEAPAGRPVEREVSARVAETRSRSRQAQPLCLHAHVHEMDITDQILVRAKGADRPACHVFRRVGKTVGIPAADIEVRIVKSDPERNARRRVDLLPPFGVVPPRTLRLTRSTSGDPIGIGQLEIAARIESAHRQVLVGSRVVGQIETDVGRPSTERAPRRPGRRGIEVPTASVDLDRPALPERAAEAHARLVPEKTR